MMYRNSIKRCFKKTDHSAAKITNIDQGVPIRVILFQIGVIILNIPSKSTPLH